MKDYEEDKYTPQDDIWSLCVTFYNCIAVSKEPIEAGRFYDASKSKDKHKFPDVAYDYFKEETA